MLLVGADAVMFASALLRNGPDYLADLIDGVRGWLDRHGYSSVEQAKGSMSQRNVANPMAFAPGRTTPRR
ncbi:MAG: hypothetical protein U0V56_10260 [Actinomycetota bacterium]